MEIREIYVLCKERSEKLAIDFLNKLLPEREAVAENYPYPEYSDDPKYIYDDSEELIKVLERNENESYSLYWNDSSDGEVKSAMIFFTEDGGMIAGITIPYDDGDAWLSKLSDIVGGKYGYVSFDSPPPETRVEFIACCEKSDQIRLVGGEVVLD